MGFFSLKSVPGGTATELQRRGDRKWDPSLGQAKTWIYVMSLAEGRPYPISTFNTFEGAYKNNRPRYVVNSFKLSSKGEFGTTRQGSLSMTIFNDDDFNNIADAYCIPDMSVRVQFGWSVDSGGAATPTPLTGASLDSEAIKSMHALAGKSAVYEGYQGRVVGWDVKYKADISAWDLTLDFIGAADSVSETGLDYSDKECQCKKEVTGKAAEEAGESESTEIIEQTSALEAVAIQLFDDPANLSNIKSLQGAPNLKAEEIAYPGFSRDRDGTEDSDSWFTIDADLDARETYVSWGTVEAMFTRCSGQLYCDNQPCSYIIDSSNVVLKTPTTDRGNWFSGDPRVCILPGGGLEFEEPTEWNDYIAVGGPVLNPIGTIVSAFIDAASGTAGFPQATGNCFVEGGVKLVDIMISTVHLNKRIKEFLNGEVKLMQAINTLLKDINVACGGIWELEVIDVSLDGGTAGVVNLAIVDANDSDGAPAFTFVTKAGSGFCRDVQIDYKPSDAMKTQALYGNQQNTSESPTGGNCTSRFMIYSKDGVKNLGKKQNVGPHDSTCSSDVCNESNAKEHPVEALQKKVVQTTVNGALNYLREQKRKKDQERASKQVGGYCAAPILPIGLSITVSGIGGFRWGQGVTCDRLPPDITNRLKWQVTGVEHNITPDDWVTTIKTIGRVVA